MLLDLREARRLSGRPARFSLAKGQNGVFKEEMKAVRIIQGATKLDPYFICVIGRIHARAGRAKEAARQLEILKSSFGELIALSTVTRSDQSDQANFYLLKGEVEVSQKTIWRS